MEAEVKKLSEVAVAKEPVRHERPNEKRQEQALVDRVDHHLVEMQRREAGQKPEKPESTPVKVAQKKSLKLQKSAAPKAEVIPKPKVITLEPKTLPAARAATETQKSAEPKPDTQSVAIEGLPATPGIGETSEVADKHIPELFEAATTDAESLLYGPILEWGEGELLLTTAFDNVETETIEESSLSLPAVEFVHEDYLQASIEPAQEWQAAPVPAEVELAEQMAEKLDDLSAEATAEVRGIMETLTKEIQKLELFEAEDDEGATEAVEAKLEQLVTRLLTVLDIEPDERTVSRFIKQLKVLVAEQTEVRDLAEDEGTHERKFGLLQMLKALLQTAKQYELPHLRLGRLVCRQMALSPI
ncbi:MAG TPA: hypothetical protein VLG13_00765, partial [Patescibacteria group bacterium]|nr:hypothetical protein [Patescibacteria group bacterium]